MSTTRDREYKRGLRDEERVINALKHAGHIVRESSKKENIYQDIDCWVNGQPVSIKSQAVAAKTGRVVFELEVKVAVDALGALDSVDPNDYVYEWEYSWFYYGQATSYLILIGERLLKINVPMLHERTIKVRRDCVRQSGISFRRLSQAAVKRQMKARHPHHDAKLMLVETQHLINEGIAQWVTFQ